MYNVFVDVAWVLVGSLVGSWAGAGWCASLPCPARVTNQQATPVYTSSSTRPGRPAVVGQRALQHSAHLCTFILHSQTLLPEFYSPCQPKFYTKGA